MAVPILAVACRGVALGCQSINMSEPTDGGEGNKSWIRSTSSSSGCPVPTVEVGGFHARGGCMIISASCRAALPPWLKQGRRAPGASVACNCTRAEGPLSPSVSVAQRRKPCWRREPQSKVLHRAGRRFGYPSFLSLALFHVPPCLALLLC